MSINKVQINSKTADSQLNVVYAFDESYAPHAACSMLSVAAHASTKIHFYVLAVDLSGETKENLREIHFKCAVEIYFIDISSRQLMSEGMSLETFGEIEVDYVTLATYARLFIDLLIPCRETVVYLDADVIAISDIVPITKIIDSSSAIAAAVDPGVEGLLGKYGIQRPDLIPGLTDGLYFNAGVLVINLTRARENQLFHRAREYVRRAHGDMLLYDQEALNAAAAGSFTVLSPSWNYMTHGDIKNTKETPVYIRHYCSHVKPWKDPSYEEDSCLYTQYVHLVPWHPNWVHNEH